MIDIDPSRVIPKDGDNPYSHHPGFSATGCQNRITVTAHRSATTSSGFACAVTGGHCHPGSIKECSLADES